MTYLLFIIPEIFQTLNKVTWLKYTQKLKYSRLIFDLTKTMIRNQKQNNGRENMTFFPIFLLLLSVLNLNNFHNISKRLQPYDIIILVWCSGDWIHDSNWLNQLDSCFFPRPYTLGGFIITSFDYVDKN